VSMKALPKCHVSPARETWLRQESAQWPWNELEPLSTFILNDGVAAAKQQTLVRLCYSGQHLYIRFDCADDDIWGTYTKRDDPIYEEEVVEVFIAPGIDTPQRYFEFEVSPKGVLFDCKIYNPSGFYDDKLEVDESWNAEGVAWSTSINLERQGWWAILEIPWQAIGGFHEQWRVNFYRIERSQQSGTEYSAWSPTLMPNMFHVPGKFGLLVCQNSQIKK
jgi:hypothetical protein